MKIGDRVRHRINGITGIVTARTEFRNGCRQFMVEQETVDKDGKPHDGLWTDEQNLEVVDAGVFEDPFLDKKLPGLVAATAGGPDRVGSPT